MNLSYLERDVDWDIAMKYAQKDTLDAILITSAYYSRPYIRQFTVDLNTEFVNLAIIHIEHQQIEHQQKVCVNLSNYE
jgi:hypothetical protein